MSATRTSTIDAIRVWLEKDRGESDRLKSNTTAGVAFVGPVQKEVGRPEVPIVESYGRNNRDLINEDYS